MTPPDLAALVLEWQARLRIVDWKITARYVADLCAYDGSPAWGLCYRFVDNRSAEILIRTPQTAAEAEQVTETVVHELLHVVLAGLASSNFEPASVAAEEQVVWTLSPLLVSLGETREGKMLARAMARAIKRPPAARRPGGRTRMDQVALLAALKGIMTAEGDAEGKLSMLTNVIGELEKAGDPASPASDKDPLKQEKPVPDQTQSMADKDPSYRKGDIGQIVRDAVRAAVEPVNKRLDDGERAELFRTQGHKLTTEQRAALASAPLTTVRAFLAATNDPTPNRAARKTEATQGGRSRAAEPDDDAELDEKMNIRSRRPMGPERTEGGGLRLHTMPPGEARRLLLAGRDKGV